MKQRSAARNLRKRSKKPATKSLSADGADVRAGEIVALLKAHANPANVEGMARFGINPCHTLGIPIPVLRQVARQCGRDHSVADRLWTSGLHEARILASMIDEPDRLTGRKMDRWVAQFDSWDVCDQCCANLFEDSPLAWSKAVEWSRKDAEFVKRAGFSLMARLAVADKDAADQSFQKFFDRIEAEASDDRPMVRKAVNWALRQIGKRNLALHSIALDLAERLRAREDRAARWIGGDAAKELRGVTAMNIIRHHEHRKATRDG